MTSDEKSSRSPRINYCPDTRRRSTPPAKQGPEPRARRRREPRVHLGARLRARLSVAREHAPSHLVRRRRLSRSSVGSAANAPPLRERADVRSEHTRGSSGSEPRLVFAPSPALRLSSRVLVPDRWGVSQDSLTFNRGVSSSCRKTSHFHVASATTHTMHVEAYGDVPPEHAAGLIPRP